VKLTLGSTGIRVAGLTLFLAVGCAKSENESLQALIRRSETKPADVHPLAGKVTIDGQTPPFVFPQRLIVMLYDPAKPNLPPAKRPCRQVSADGEFAFGTFTKEDGLPAGKFIATFAVLEFTTRGLQGPDQLKNLYNDPDKNALLPEFNIDHEGPGKKDYHFELKLSGQEANGSPGPNALTQLVPLTK